MIRRICKKVGIAVEFVGGYCELAEECANDTTIKCGQCSPAKIKAGNKLIKIYCKSLLEGA